MGKINFSNEKDYFNVSDNQPELQPNTPYMLRQDGVLLTCGSVHPYIKNNNWDIKTNIEYLINKNPEALEWFKDNAKDKELLKLINSFSVDMSEDDFNRMNDLSNEEFCRVRTSNYKYKYGGNNGEIYFRISSKEFNWFDNIWDIIIFNSKKSFIKKITVMQDPQTFGTKTFKYFNSKQGLINNMNIEDFLSLNDFSIEKINESKDDISNEMNEIDSLINDIYKLRQDSIANEGEYGLGNLVFKEFRNLGYLDNLKDIKTKLEDKEMSISQ